MNIGDVITTAEDLDRLPARTIVVGAAGISYQKGLWDWFCSIECLPSIALSVDGPLTILALPGRRPRPERVVKAEALREAAAYIKGSQYGAPLPVSQVFGILHGRATYLEAGDLT